MDHRFNPHKITWTEEKSARFWDYLSSKPFYQENNFSKLAGEVLIKFIERHGVVLRGSALDFGCGCGFGKSTPGKISPVSGRGVFGYLSPAFQR
jgi:hypothetical protein